MSSENDSESYMSNSKKEKVLLGFCDNFQRQFRKLYGDRKALFLKLINEHGVEVPCNVVDVSHDVIVM